jgi:hypothetical protein
VIEPSDRTVEKWRFSEVDYSSAFNNFGGFLNAPNFPNWSAFAALKADGSITAWGNSHYKLNKSWYSHYQRVRLYLHYMNYPTP